MGSIFDEGIQALSGENGSALPGAPAATSGASPSPASSNPFAEGVAALGGGAAVTPASSASADSSGIGYSADNPIQQSPLGIADRFKLSFGNDKGKLDFLKKKFDDAANDPTAGFVVKKDGKWFAVDPSGTGSGGILARGYELAKDAADLGDIGLNAATAGPAAVAGGAVGGFPGAVAGAGVGGTVSGAIRTELGKAFGTYEATPEEQLKDTAWEGLLSAGGQAAASGLGAIAKAAKKIGTVAGEGAKDALAFAWGHSTGAGESAIRTLFDDSGKVVSGIKNYLQKAGNDSAAAAGEARDAAIGKVKELLGSASEGFYKTYGNLLNSLVESPKAENMKVDMGSLFDKAAQTIEDSGFGKVEQPNPNGSFKFSPFTAEEESARIQAGQPLESLTEDQEKEVSNIVRQMGNFKEIGEVSGSDAVTRLTNFNKRLNQLQRDAMSSTGNNSAYFRALTKIGSAFHEAVGQEFDKAGMGDEYAQLAQHYAQYGESVKMAQALADQPGGAETLLKKISQENPKMNRTAKGLMGNLVDMAGPKGQQLQTDIAHLNAVSALIPKLPSSFTLSQLGAAGIGLKAATSLTPSGIAAAGAMVAGAPNFSPRLVAQGVNFAQNNLVSRAASQALPYASQMTNFLKNIPPSAMAKFLADDPSVQQMVKSTIDAYTSEQPTTDALVKHGMGVVNGQ